MEKIEAVGVLEFLTWDRPWKLDLGQETVDLREKFWEWAKAAKGKRAAQNYAMDSYTVGLAGESDFVVDFSEVGAGLLLSKPDGFGFSNVGAYLAGAMQMLNARRCSVLIADEGFSIAADDAADPAIHGVRYCEHNSARVLDQDAKRVCRPGSKDTCIFLTMSVGGWRCQKFDTYMARQLLDRHARRDMNASRIGNCRLLGREPEEAA